MKYVRHLLLAIALVTLSQFLKAEVFSFRHYKAEDGLSFNTVRNIIQDHNGFIWLGTEDGLNRFDGYSFKTYRNNKTNNLISNYISALYESKNGIIYIGTDQGVSTFEAINEKFALFNIATNEGVTITGEVNNIVEDKNGNIWFSTYGKGVFKYNPAQKKLEQYKPIIDKKEGTSSDMVNCIFVDSHNNVWAAARTKDALFLFDSANNNFYPAKMLFDKANTNLGNVYKIIEDSNNTIWLGTWDQGLGKYNPTTKKITFHLSPAKPNGILHVHDILEYKPGLLMVGSDDGLSIFNTLTQAHTLLTSSETDPSSLSDKFVYPIFKDREGGIWIGTYYGGVNYLPPSGQVFERYTHSKFVNSVNGKIISGFTEDKDGNIWIASDDGGLNYFDTKTGQFKWFMPKVGQNSISYYNVHGLCWDDDYLWVGTYSGGLNRYNTSTGKFTHYTSNPNDENTIDGTSIYTIYRDSKKQIWAASMSGINIYNRKDDNFTRVKDLGTTTFDILEDDMGVLWFATWSKGLYSYNPHQNQWTNYIADPNNPNSISGNQLNCLFLDDKGLLWIGTSTGLCYFDRHKKVFTQVELETASNTICSIIADGEVLWLTTAKGLVRYNKANGACQVFTQKDGLLSDQFIFKAGFKSSTGKIYIGTAQGFNAFEPKNIISNNYIPPVVVNRLEIFNKEVEMANYGSTNATATAYDEINLSYKDNVFSLGFVALSYNNPEKNKYAYKLEGFDKDWNHVTNQLKATYTNLPAGNYVFRVIASNNDGIWNNEGASLNVIIHPPIWKTLPAKIFYIILLISLIILLVRMFIMRTDRKHREKIEQLKHEKEKEVYDAKIGFFTMIAHEIRTPVSLIIGPLEKMMATNPHLPDGIKKDLNIIDRNSQRLLLLVNQLLDFRKAEQGALVINYMRSNIYSLLQSIYDRFSPLIDQHGIEFVLDCPDKTFDADVDQEFVTKMVSNLLSNALKFANSKIVLACRQNKTSALFEIQVTDDGNGIADSEKEKIFDPFYQINPQHKSGTGIGLSLVKNLVDAHNGTIAVLDALPSGASFSITLPLRSGTIVEQNIQHHQLTSTLKKNGADDSDALIDEIAGTLPDKPYLLIVEDNTEMRNFLSDSFSSEYQIVTAVDGVDGLEKVKSAEINLVISDLMMPRMNGLMFCQALKSNLLTSHIPIVMLTAKADIDSKIEGLNFGADAYIEKPFSVKFLKAQIRNLIESRKSLRSKYAEMPFVPINSIAGNQADEEFLTQMNAIIENNISNIDFTIDMLAEQLCISRSGFFSKIKSLAGVTPNELIQVVRLKKAAELLSANKYRINEVAYMVGYNDPSYFSKCFVKQFGIRPGDFINKHRSEATQA
jgi:signal transduction histidine kinase/ligand-binding sensor domain-containing protein/DNA-binding response OmpR family regulator